jgi:PmbA protein
MKNAPQPTSASNGFSFSRRHFEGLVDEALAHARRLGASDAGVEVSEGSGLSVSVRKGHIENVERNRDKSIGVTVYLGQRRGNASTSDFSPARCARRCRRPTTSRASPPRTQRRRPARAGRSGAGERGRAGPGSLPSLGHRPERATEMALRCEAAALATDRRITNSEGAAFRRSSRISTPATAVAFAAAMPARAHSLSVRPSPGGARHAARRLVQLDARCQ